MSGTDSPDDAVSSFTALIPMPGGVTDLDGLAARYNYPERPGGQPWVRANFINSTDGAATVSGRSGGLGGAGDRVIFGMLRELADVIMVGAGTVRVEHYSGVRVSDEQRHRRRGRGQAAIPRLAVVTRSGDLAPDLSIFTRTEITPLILTSRSATPAVRERLGDLAEVVDCSTADPDEVDVEEVVGVIAGDCGPRVLVEGGPTLLNTLLQRGLVDELCLTVAPVLLGGEAPRIAHGCPVASPTSVRCEQLLTDADGYFYARYVKSA